MKVLATFASLLLAVSAAPVAEKRAATSFEISNFSSNTQPHGDGAFVAYDISIPGELVTFCSFVDTSSTTKLPNFGFVQCANPLIDWQFRQDPSGPGAEGRYRIVVRLSNADGSKTVGFHEWNAAEFPLQAAGTTQETVYTGAKSFTITNLQ